MKNVLQFLQMREKVWSSSLHKYLFVLGLPVHFILTLFMSIKTTPLEPWDLEKKRPILWKASPSIFYCLFTSSENAALQSSSTKPGVLRAVPRCPTCSGCTNATSPRTPAQGHAAHLNTCTGIPTSIFLVGNAMLSWNIWNGLKFATLSCHLSGRSLFWYRHCGGVQMFPSFRGTNHATPCDSPSPNLKSPRTLDDLDVRILDLWFGSLIHPEATNSAGHEDQPPAPQESGWPDLSHPGPACPVRAIAELIWFPTRGVPRRPVFLWFPAYTWLKSFKDDNLGSPPFWETPDAETQPGTVLASLYVTGQHEESHAKGSKSQCPSPYIVGLRNHQTRHSCERPPSWQSPKTKKM